MLSFPKTIFQNTVIAAIGLALFFMPSGPVFGTTATEGVIRVNDLRLRSGPGLNFPPIARLQKGDKVRVLGERNGWLHIESRGRIGHIKKKDRFIRLVVPRVETAEKDRKTDQLKQGSTEIEKEIQKFEADLKRFSEEETAVLNALDEIERSLSATVKKIAGIGPEIGRIDGEISQTRQKSHALSRRIEAGQAQMSKRLVALYKLSWLGTANILASADSIYDIVLTQDQIERILTQDEHRLAALAADKVRLAALISELNARKQKKLELEAEYKTVLQKLFLKKAKRALVLEVIRSKKSLEIAALNALKKAAAELDHALNELDKNPPPPGPADVQILSKPFSEFKGLLQMPAEGKIISVYGRYTNPKYKVVNFQSGIDIQAEAGQPVRAVFHGRILYANWFKGYGNMIIIDHGESYYTVYAHANEIFKQKGDPVEAGEVIATVGDSGSLTGAKLHFEVRHHGQPINPLDWIKKS